MKDFFRELQKRKVYSVGAAYVIIAWLLLQVASVVFPIYAAPDWVLQTFTTALFLGFPVALVLAWAYDLTPAGVKRTRSLDTSDASDPLFAREPSGQSSPTGASGDEVALPSGPSIAVLPFSNLSGDPEQGLFTEALCGDIITGLTQSSHLFVLSAGATSGIDDPDNDLIGIGKRLGVSYLLQGSVRKSGQTLRVSARLQDASNGVQLWSQNYDKELSAESLFAVQDDIREQIVATLSDLHGVIYSAQSKKNIHRPTDSLDAYECLSVALAYDKYLSEEYHLRARESLERAVEIDPQYDEAWSHLSWIYTDEWLWGFNRQPQPMERALDAAEKAIRLDPNNYHSRWLLSRVHYFMGDLDRFLAESDRSLELNSSDGTALGLIGVYRAWSGDWERGIEMVQKAKLLNPNYPDYYHVAIASADFAAGEYSAALENLLRAKIPEWPPLHTFLAATYAKLGRNEEAARHLEQLKKLQGHGDPEGIRTALNKNFPFQPGYVDRIMTSLELAGLEAHGETPG